MMPNRMTAVRLLLEAVPGIPPIRPGDDLGSILIECLDGADMPLKDRDVLVVAQKIVSKAEGRLVDLATVSPSARARALADATAKDPRLVELILSESREVVRHRPGVLVVEHRLGFVMANAGIDRSNVAAEGGREMALLLPIDPDATCRVLKRRLDARFGADAAVIVNDSVGRAWRNGTVGMALGAAGLPALDDRRGQKDFVGRTLEVTEVGLADEIAAAASALMGQGDEGRPAVVVRGLSWQGAARPARDLIRSRDIDLFR